MKTINIIATTISGSIKDWKKIGLIQEEFEKFYPGKIEVFIVDSHKDARDKANELVHRKELIIVSAGGSGTFNSILEGCRMPGGYPDNLRLAFLRKGSADLLGKVLNIPDKLSEAANIMVNSIMQDKTIESDVIELNIDDKNYHFIGFGGVGVFGIVPYFTESKIKKYYKGILSYLFGDRGPFLFGVNLAIFKFYIQKFIRKSRFNITADGINITDGKYANIIIMNGDLGKDFPIAEGMPLATGDFQVFLLKDFGLINTYRQLVHAWKGDLDMYKDKLGLQIFRTKKLTISSKKPDKYMVNVDGLLVQTGNQIKYKISDRLKLITG